MKSGVRDIDNGFLAFLQMQKTGPDVQVGILPAEGAQPKVGSDLTLGEVAAINEFGDDSAHPPVPERSFIRRWVDTRRAQIVDRLRVEATKVVIEKKYNLRVALDRFGLWAVGEIQQRIADGIPPPNAQSTVDRKGSSTPLIETGQLRASIKHKVSG